MRNRNQIYNNSGFREDFNYSNNNGSSRFNNLMSSNNNYRQHPRGSAFTNQDFRRFNGSNINLDNQY